MDYRLWLSSFIVVLNYDVQGFRKHMTFNLICLVLFCRKQLISVYAHLTIGEKIQRLPRNTVVLGMSYWMSSVIFFEKSWKRNLFLGSVESGTQ
jgi:hypothetical protein